MVMDNEQVTTKLAVMESQMQSLVQSNQRIESSLEKIASFDKSLAEVIQKHSHLSEKMIEVEKETEKCAQSHARETEKLWNEVSTLNKLAHKANGIAIGALVFIGIITTIASASVTFLFNTTNENKASIIEQKQMIRQLDKAVDKLK